MPTTEPIINDANHITTTSFRVKYIANAPDKYMSPSPIARFFVTKNRNAKNININKIRLDRSG